MLFDKKMPGKQPDKLYQQLVDTNTGLLRGMNLLDHINMVDTLCLTFKHNLLTMVNNYIFSYNVPQMSIRNLNSAPMDRSWVIKSQANYEQVIT